MKYGLGVTGGRPSYARWSTPLLSSEYQWEGRSWLMQLEAFLQLCHL